jgi:hypothetical protein
MGTNSAMAQEGYCRLYQPREYAIMRTDIDTGQQDPTKKNEYGTF